MRTLLFLFFIFLFFVAGYAQSGVQGQVFGPDGEPLAYAAVYVPALELGTASNADGYYELRLPPGQYRITFQYLGYQTETKDLEVGTAKQTMDMVMQREALSLKEVEVSGSQEDPAYTVMRKAIAKAEYHRQQVDRYQVEVYLKGSGRIKEAPAFMEDVLREGGLDSTTAFTTESVSELTYERPNTYREKVISIYSVGNDNDLTPNSYIQSSFYDPIVSESVSPLSPRAFGYYRFQHEGFFRDRGYGINKIRVTPRRRGEGVFEGHIYIVEDEWSIHSLSLVSYKLGFELATRQIYTPVEPAVWLPTNQRYDISGKMLGILFEYNYLAALSGYDVQLNEELAFVPTVVDPQVEPSPTPQNQKKRDSGELEERLQSGKPLTAKELRRLMRAYAKSERKENKDAEVIENTTLIVDSMAVNRDSAYWAEKRSVPLTAEERKGYRRVDSLAQVQAEDSLATTSARDTGLTLLSVFSGRTHELGRGRSITHGSLWDRFFFNPVEGFNLHTEVVYAVDRKAQFTVGIVPRLAMATGRFSGQGFLTYDFGREQRHGLRLEGGRYIFQYNADQPISQLFNTYLNLVEERNYIRLYEKEYARLSYRHALHDNWTLIGSVEWANRRHPSNATDWTINDVEDRVYASNSFFNETYVYPIPERERAAITDLTLEARPWQRFAIVDGKRMPVPNSSPLFRLHYRQGVPDVLESVTDYSLLRLEVEHRWPVGVQGDLSVKASAGHFWNNTYVGFADFQHFMGNRIAVLATDPVASYRLLPYYQYSTNETFGTAHVHQQFRKLALTQLTAVWMLGIKENLAVHYLTTPEAGQYVEVGYGIDNIFRFFRLEGAVSFQDGQYRDWGVFVGIASGLGNGVFTVR